MNKYFVPDRGDIVWLTFTPVRGHEQGGRRPALVVSPKNYNLKSGLALCCPITSKVKGYPFEVSIHQEKVKGAVLTDQIRSIDWHERAAKFLCKIKKESLLEVQSKINLLVN